MSARDLLRVGFILLGSLLIVSALASLVESLNHRPAFMASGEQPVPALLRSVLFLGGLSVVTSLVFGVLPGVLLITRSERWSQRFVPNASSLPSIPSSVLLAVAFMLLGVFFGVQGLAGIVGSVVGLVAQVFSEGEAYAAFSVVWQTLGSSLVYFTAGVVLFRWGRQSVLNAG